MAATSTTPTNQEVQAFRETLLADFKLMCLSREASLLGRKEVLTGKAKFGIFGDGKEMAQVALAKVLQPGDWRSGYYRDQTLMMAKGLWLQILLQADVRWAATSPPARWRMTAAGGI
jgi:TPP-dependent pyruvate/acetoin dehydrogenase alpha subunit